MKVLTINHDRCNLCGEELGFRTYNPKRVEARIERRGRPVLRYCIPFHASCWKQASGSSVYGDFTYREWTNLTGGEWDVYGLVKFCQKGKIIGYHHKSEWILDHEAEELINS